MERRAVGFSLLTSANFFRLYIPIIMACHRAGLDVFLVCPADNPQLVNTSLDDILRKNGVTGSIETVYYSHLSALPAVLKAHDIREFVVVNFQSETYGNALREMKKNGVSINVLQWYGDFLALHPEQLAEVNRVFVYNEHMVEYYQQEFSHFDLTRDLAKFIPVGNYVFDGVPLALSKKEEFSVQYGLAGKKTVLVMTQHLPYFSSVSRMSLFFKGLFKPGTLGQKIEILRGPSYKKLFLELKKWCHAQNALLIVKSRAKHDEPDFVQQNADLFLVDGDNYFPTVTLRMLAVADVLISIWSTAVIEAAQMGVFNITIQPPAMSMPNDSPANRFLSPRLFEHPGVTTCVNYKDVSRFLSSHSLNDLQINGAERSAYLEKFSGPLDNHASDRIVDHLKKN